MSFLELVNIKKSYQVDGKTFHVLNGISLDFNRGEFVSVLGESGGGKTTLMNIIAGLDSNYEGDVIVDGKSLKNDTTKQLDEYRRSTIGFIFQSFNLISHLTVLENVMVSLAETNLSHKQQVERARELLAKVGLADHANKYPNQLSGGQKQRVSIARALAPDPDIIIADEPTGALDAQNTDEILALMNDIAKDGKLVIAVTHSQIVADYGTRIVHLANGVIDEDKIIKPAYPVHAEPKPFKDKVASAGEIFAMAWNHFKYNWKRNLLIMFGAAIGIFSVIVMLGLGNGVKGYINHEIFSQVNPTAIQVTKKAAGQGDDQAAMSKINMTDKNEHQLSKIKHVKSTEKGMYYGGNTVQVNAGKQTVGAQMLQTNNKTIKAKSIKKGSVKSGNNIVISNDMAKKLDKANPYSVIGKHVKLSITAIDGHSPKTLTRDVKVSGISSQMAIAPYDLIKAMYVQNHVQFKPNFITVNVKGGVKNVEPVQNKIKTLKNDQGKKEYAITGAGSIVSTLNTYVNLAVGVLTAIAAISLLVSAIMIIVVLYISVSERTKEIGILRALGYTKRNISNLFIFEAFLIGFFSSIVAVVLSYLAEFGVNAAVNGAIHYSLIQISVVDALAGVIISIVICLLAAILPAHKAAKVDPVVSLSAE